MPTSHGRIPGRKRWGCCLFPCQGFVSYKCGNSIGVDSLENESTEKSVSKWLQTIIISVGFVADCGWQGHSAGMAWGPCVWTQHFLWDFHGPLLWGFCGPYSSQSLGTGDGFPLCVRVGWGSELSTVVGSHGCCTTLPHIRVLNNTCYVMRLEMGLRSFSLTWGQGVSTPGSFLEILGETFCCFFAFSIF